MLPLVAILFLASSSPPVAGLSPAASASSSASRSPPVVARTDCASSSPRVTKVSTDASASSSPFRATDRGAAPVWSSATPASVLPNSASSDRVTSPVANATVGSVTTAMVQRARWQSVESIRWVRSASASPGSATVGSATTFDADAQRVRSVTVTTPSSSSSPGRMLLILSVVAAILAAAGGWAARGGSDGEQQRAATDDYCEVCFVRKAVFLLECCKKPACNFCLRDFVRGRGHDESCKRLVALRIVPLLHPHEFEIGSDVPEGYTHLEANCPRQFSATFSRG